MRKTAQLGAIEGLALETLLLAPLAAGLLGWWTWRGDSALASAGPEVIGWLLLAGPLTALPLVFFAAGARRLPLATLGLMQYLSPSIQFALGVWLFHEPFGRTQFVGFGLIWIALLVYSTEAFVVGRQRAAEATPA
jgi:chloramphenicol-sensitive protein RarD